MSFDQLIAQINSLSTTQRDRGTYFEYLVRAYLQNEPTYKNEFRNVWMLKDVPSYYGIPKTDIGVDLVAETYRGTLVAIQAKFYNHKIQKANIDSFLGELGKSYYESGIIISSTDNWGRNAELALADREDVLRIGLSDLKSSQVDWDAFSFEQPEYVQLKEKKRIRLYQQKVLNDAIRHFVTEGNSRGQIIMAPGTGKTFTSLKIAEEMAKLSGKDQFTVLYLVPSIQLLTQTLRGWNNDAELSISSMAVTSDRNASRAATSNDDDESIISVKASDIGYPATTSAERLLKNYEDLKKQDQTDLLVVFSTYQSIDVLGDAQKEGFPDFDLIIADEAHRTTGATALGQEASLFTRVHDDANVRGTKRLYQTATPKLYGPDARQTAEMNSIEISSMDDESIYGPVIHRLGFGQAIGLDILTDYKLMVLAVDEAIIQRDMQTTLSDPENGLNIDDVGRIIGVWNGMVKRDPRTGKATGSPMKRAIAFTSTINNSKALANQFESVVNDYLDSEDGYTVNVRHADGSMNALEKGDALDWLARDDIPFNSARILSNVRFLTEGIDVPNLDAIIFLSPRKSQVDIVQAVGRVIRKFEGKDYGYIILPIVIPSGTDPAEILDNNRKYDVIWQVLNALRSVDERFEATINKLELNKKKPNIISVIDVGEAPDNPFERELSDNERIREEQTVFDYEYHWDELEGAIYGQIVRKLGNRRYLEDWSEDVATIARRHIQGIDLLLDQSDEVKTAFHNFLNSLRHNINESITEPQAIEMLAQHLITKPVFDALFDEYSFIQTNPVSQAMERIIDEFSKYGFEKEQAELQPFYESVKVRAGGIDNAEAKQKIIVTLYDKFFSTGFKSTTERLGIVFTPVEVVDFIIKSVDAVLRKHFDKTLASENVHILDPFTGTGTFITRTLQYLKSLMDQGEITYEDILRKYTQELHANEIVLLSYYIAAINIEAVFDDINGEEVGYVPFEGIVLTDTFESTEVEDVLDDSFLGTNDKRLKRQQDKRITAIIGNPPYSVGQSNQNDNNQNMSYQLLDTRIAETYVNRSAARSSRSTYDSYIRAFRWASDRIEEGIVAFVSNGSYLNSNSTDGLRACLYEEFNHLYIFNLRGNATGQGEARRREKGNVFGSGTRTTIAISILVKDGSNNHDIHYYDIGDYLSRDEKIEKIVQFGDVTTIPWDTLIPDEYNDWLNLRDTNYSSYNALAGSENAIFANNIIGVVTNRDSWVINYSKGEVQSNVKRLIENYNNEVRRSQFAASNSQKFVLNRDSHYIKWTRKLERHHRNGTLLEFDESRIVQTLYRPFTKKWLYYSEDLNEETRLYYRKFGSSNIVITTTGRGASRDFSVLATNMIPNMDSLEKSQGFMRFDKEVSTTQLFHNPDNLTQEFADCLGLSLDDTFYYVYGVLHSREYQEKYANDLKKDLARIPILKNIDRYVEIGKKLMNLHISYENIAPYVDVKIESSGTPNYSVTKMKFAKKRDANGKSVKDMSKIIFNEDITICDIPEKAYEYMVNGRPAIEWIIDQYQVKTDKKSGIKDDPNEYSEDEKYILNLLLKVINVSVQSVDLINSLPTFEVVK